MAKKPLIDALGLGPRIREILKSGVTVAAEIHRMLGEEFPEKAIPSADTVRRYVADIKDDATRDAERIISDHVARVVPDDLAALEEMEATCLAWSREGARTQAERVAAAVETMTGELEAWRRELSRPHAEPRTIARRLIQRAAALLAQDDERQDARLRAMKQASAIIELKLRNAGLLNDEGKGRIVIVQPGETHEAEDRRGILRVVRADGER